MNHPPPSAVIAQRSLPTARALAVMALQEVTPNPRPDQRPDDGDPEPRIAGGPGWFDSSFELGRGLIVLEGLPAQPSLAEWLEQSLYR